MPDEENGNGDAEENESAIPGHLANLETSYSEGGAHETSPPRRTAEEEANVGEVGKLAGTIEPLKLPDETVPTEAVAAASEDEEPEDEA